MKIERIEAFQIYDSRGNPTVECAVTLENGAVGAGLVPSGASTGRNEAFELRDGEPHRLRGNSVYTAIDNIESVIAPRLLGADVFAQADIDRDLCELDGTANKSRLGANAILAVSMAIADAAAAARQVPLFEYLGDGLGNVLPLPQIQLFGGGAHSAWRTDVQDFLIIPLGASNYPHALEMTHNVYHAAGEWMRKRNKYCGVADEGGYWPEFENHGQVLDAIIECIELAGYTPGRDMAIALDIAAGELYEGTSYRFNLENKSFDTEALLKLLLDWCSNYPVISLEDPFSDRDWAGWEALYGELGSSIQLIGDDLFTTNPELIKRGVERRQANAVLIKPNQIGTVSETLAAIRCTQQAGWRPVVSARSGETEDVFISHLAVATNAGQIKVGSFARGERMAKWNELLRIERCLRDDATFLGKQVFEPLQGMRFLPKIR
ncbi:phosphopyruvate hydratase [Gammaproteobacteria bacterium]|nr:phosphopyruvate hydratase [Gammaproteobacteria bacterium]